MIKKWIKIPTPLEDKQVFEGDTGIFKILRYNQCTEPNNMYAGLPYHAIIHMTSGTICFLNNDSKQTIRQGETCLISPGSYPLLESINSKKYSCLVLFFYRQTAQYMLRLPGVINYLKNNKKIIAWQNIYIIPPLNMLDNFFRTLDTYYELDNQIKEKIIPLKFAELIYLLQESPHRTKVLSFLKDASVKK